MRHYCKWAVICSLVGGMCGIASASFLILLDTVTLTRNDHVWLIYFLPLAGLIVGGLYRLAGKKAQGGNNLLVDEFHNPRTVVPLRTAPLVFFTSLVTHLFGGSAGREGAAVQIGGSLADQFTDIAKLDRASRRTLLVAGMSGGFGSIFGVPFAGMIFGLEVVDTGRLHIWAIAECAIASFVAHYVTLILGGVHTSYPHPIVDISLTGTTLICVIAAGIGFGAVARLFVASVETVKCVSQTLLPHPSLRALCGGAVVCSVFSLAPLTLRYAGLGIPIMIDTLQTIVLPFDWLGKLLLTAITLGVGFQGGEVTPLLFVGSTLGNALSAVLPLPIPVLAAIGFVGVFAGAANVPLAAIVMAIEIFGRDIGLFAALACLTSYIVSSRHGIYHRQQAQSATADVHRRRFKSIELCLRRPTLE